jgi:hypothetical protein
LRHSASTEIFNSVSSETFSLFFRYLSSYFTEIVTAFGCCNK